MEVHHELGCGFLEAVYQEALSAELDLRGIPYLQQVELPVSYKQATLKCSYRTDFICFDSVIVEIKALSNLRGVDQAQLINYLKITGLEIGLLLNFGAVSLQYKRLANSRSQSV